jgi:hypothetical protein
VLVIFLDKKKLENATCGSVKCSKDVRIEDLVDSLVIWVWQVNVKNGTAADEVIKEQAKVTG